MNNPNNLYKCNSIHDPIHECLTLNDYVYALLIYVTEASSHIANLELLKAQSCLTDAADMLEDMHQGNWMMKVDEKEKS